MTYGSRRQPWPSGCHSSGSSTPAGATKYKRITAARAASIAGRGEEFAQAVTEANKLRPPGLLVRDAYAAYETGAATLRPYANLLGVDVDELRRELESEDGIHDPS